MLLSPLAALVDAAFAPEGTLARGLPHFHPRTAQADMAQAVAQTIDRGGALVVEAGTGVGKTFAYLVPALLSGERVLISTATKSLQDQLFARDLPRLMEVLALPLKAALLKGRSSYLCLHRMEQARQDGLAGERALQRVLARVEVWAQGTRTGDLAELPGLDERSPVIPLVTSTRENCLGSGCPRLRECHVNLARREALAADVVVINHHLFFADLAVRESGMAELLPSVRVVVFDEAHQLNATGVQFLGVQFSTGQLHDLARDLLQVGLQHARGWVDWPELAQALRQGADGLRATVAGGGAAGGGGTASGTRLSWAGEAPEGADPRAWGAALQALEWVLRRVLEGLDTVADRAPDFARLHERAVLAMERLAHWAQPCPPEATRWADAGLHLRLVESPLDIAPRLAPLWSAPKAEDGAWDEPEDGSGGGVQQSPASGASAGPGERGRAWIFTSATLGTDEALSWFTEPCGLQDARILRVGSPFDYATQAALYVPPHLPSPADPRHTDSLARWVGDAVQRLGGRTLVLTTTLKALRGIGAALQQRFAASSAIEVLVQGQGTKRELMERFRNESSSQHSAWDEDGAAPGQGRVLVASASFWEGFDVPGSALQLVVIDKLPFPPPGDPLVDARGQQLERAGRSAFRDFALPEAAVALKQGAGRLIRSETDTGVLVVADTRLVTMGYGKRLLRALPPMRRIETQEAFDQALDALLITRTSTTD
ncbi:ATP-dependent DNA helicase [Paracidovorax wautersii]|uniref:ATP-dependent DNA helicase n=1 Tax=Paracidovorax wautersii TaxID=1177982 RepID=UPI0031DD887D